MGKSSIFIMIFILLSKVLGFARDVVLSSYYGVSNVSDAYLLSMSIPVTLFTFIGVSIATIYIPMYNEIEKNESKESASSFSMSILLPVVTLSFIIALFTFFNSKIVVKLFAFGFEGETLALASDFTKILSTSFLFIGLKHLINAHLKVKGVLASPFLVGVPRNIIIIGAIVFSETFGVKVLFWGSVLAIISEFVTLSILLRCKRIKFFSKPKIKVSYILEFCKLSIPVMLGTSVSIINRLIDRNMASLIISGGISVLNYAVRLNQFIQGLFVVSITTVIFPAFSKHVVNDDESKLTELAQKSMNYIVFGLLPTCMGFIIFSNEIITLVYGRGSFTGEAIKLTSDALRFYSFSLVFVGLREVLIKIYYAKKNTKTPMINSSIGVTINIILNLILANFIGLNGLPIATTISSVVIFTLMYTDIKRRYNLKITLVSLSNLKIVLATLVMGTGSYMLFNNLINQFDLSLSMLITVVSAVILFIILSLLLGSIQALELFDKIKVRVLKR